jgi:hypothetical protein
MMQEADHQHLADDRRQEIFRTIVEAQDQGIEVSLSRGLAIQRFGVSESQIRLIEQEGMDHNWPPL